MAEQVMAEQTYKEKELVSYQSKVITVSNPGTASIVIYAHPKEKILFEFDINSLNKEVVNGDLVIHTYSGGSITIANFAIMTMENENPEITDILENSYNGQDLFKDTVPFVTADDPTPYVISRKISSPKSVDPEGQYLSTADTSEKAEDSSAKYTGNTPIDQQSPVTSIAAMVQPYAIKTLLFPTEKKYDVDVNFTYNGRTVFNQEQPNKKTTPIIEQPPTLTPNYGTATEIVENTENPGDLNTFYAYNGGGAFPGIESSFLMYVPQEIDIGSFNDGKPIHYIGTTDQMIKRSMTVDLPMPNVNIEFMVVTGVKEGVRLVNNKEVTVQKAGVDTYIIKPRVLQSTLTIDFEYDGAKVPEFKSNMTVTIEGYNPKYNKVVHGTTNFKFEIKDVYSDADISSGYRTYTFSRQIDPLIVFGTEDNDIFNGGIANNHKFDTKAGDDIFYSGVGSETINLGYGDDTFVYSKGADVVDGGDGLDTISFQEGLNLDQSNLTIIFNNGGELLFQFQDVEQGKNPKITDFEFLSLDKNVNHIVINSTVGFADNQLIITGNNDIGVADILDFRAATTIDLITTKFDNIGVFSTGGGARIKFQQSTDRVGDWKYLGSNAQDILRTTGDIKIDFDGKAGYDKVEYDITAITYFADDYKVSSGSNEDMLFNIEALTGSQSNDMFYGSLLDGAMAYTTSVVDVGDNDTLRYNDTAGSVSLILDYQNIDDKDIKINKGSNKLDTVHGIVDEVYASNNNDSFILNSMTELTIHGEAGTNNVTFKGTDEIKFNINASGYTAQGIANINLDKIQEFYGTTGENTFTITGFQYETIAHKFVGNNSADMLDYGGFSKILDVTINGVDQTKGISGTSKRTVSGGQAVNDSFSNINTIIGTRLSGEYDQFLLKDITWNAFSTAGIVIDGGEGVNIGTDAAKRGDEFTYAGTGDIVAKDFAGSLLNIESVTMSGSAKITLFVEDLPVENIQHYYSTNTASTLSARYSDTAIVATINQNDKSSLLSFGPSYTLSAFGFSRFEGTGYMDTFKVHAELGRAYFVDGGLEKDVLDYTNTTIDLTFDLDKARVYKGNGIGISPRHDEFANIEDIIGGAGNDTFKLDVNNSYNIDGSGGENRVSFENYLSPLTNVDFTFYKNIQGYILTTYGDNITLTDNDMLETNYVKLSVNGGQYDNMVDTLDLSELTNGANLSIDKNTSESIDPESTYLQLAVGVDVYHAFTSFENIMLNEQANNITSNTLDLQKTVSQISGWYTLGFTGGSTALNTLDLTDVNDSVDINLNQLLPSIDDEESYISVSNNATKSRFMLYDKSTKTINLGTSTTGNKLIITETTIIPDDLDIDLGLGVKDVLSFEAVSNTLDVQFEAKEVTVAIGTAPAQSYSVAGYEGVEGGGGDDTFHVADNLTYRNLAIDGGLGLKNALLFKKTLASNSLDINMTTGIAKINNDSGATILTATIENMQVYDAGEFNSVFTAKEDSGNINTFIGNNINSVLKYSASSDKTMTFKIGYEANEGYNGSVIRLVNSADQFAKMTTLQGSNQKSSIFILDDTILNATGTTVLTVVGGTGGNSIVRFTGAFTVGLDFDFSAKTVAQSGGSVFLNMNNINKFTGTTSGDNFKLNDTYVQSNGVLDGNKGEDTIDLGVVSKAGIVDLSSGTIKYDRAGPNDPILTYQNMGTSTSSGGTIKVGHLGIQVIVANSIVGGVDTFDLSNSTDPSKNIISYQKKTSALIDFDTASNADLGGITATGGRFGSFILTNLADSVLMKSNSGITLMDEILLNAGLTGAGADSINYQVDTSWGAMTLTLKADNTQAVEFKNANHNLLNFETFILDSGQVNNINISNYAKAFNFKNDSTTNTYSVGKNSFTYEGKGNLHIVSFTIDLVAGTVLKKDPTTGTTKVDKINGFNSIITTKNSTDTVYLTADKTFLTANITLDGGDEVGTANDTISLDKVDGLDIATSFTTITNNEVIFSNHANNKYIFSNFNKIIGSKYNDYFKFDGTTPLDNQHIESIVGGEHGKIDFSSIAWTGTDDNKLKAGNILDVSGATDNIEIDVKAGTLTKDSTNWLKFNGIDTFVGSATKTNIFSGAGGSSTKPNFFVGGAATDDSVNYTGLSQSLTLTIESAGDVKVGSDKLEKIEVIGATNQNDTFIYNDVNSSISKLKLDGAGGRDVAELRFASSCYITLYGFYIAGSTSINLNNVEIYKINTTGSNAYVSLTADITADTKVLLEKEIISADATGTENTGNKGTLSLNVSGSKIDITEKLDTGGTTSIGYNFKFTNAADSTSIYNTYKYFNAYTLNANSQDVTLQLGSYNFNKPASALSVTNAGAGSSVVINTVENLKTMQFNATGGKMQFTNTAGSVVAPILEGATSFRLLGNTSSIDFKLENFSADYDFSLDKNININASTSAMAYDDSSGGLTFTNADGNKISLTLKDINTSSVVITGTQDITIASNHGIKYFSGVTGAGTNTLDLSALQINGTTLDLTSYKGSLTDVIVISTGLSNTNFTGIGSIKLANNMANTVKINFQTTVLNTNATDPSVDAGTQTSKTRNDTMEISGLLDVDNTISYISNGSSKKIEWDYDNTNFVTALFTTKSTDYMPSITGATTLHNFKYTGFENLNVTLSSNTLTAYSKGAAFVGIDATNKWQTVTANGVNWGYVVDTTITSFDGKISLQDQGFKLNAQVGVGAESWNLKSDSSASALIFTGGSSSNTSAALSFSGVINTDKATSIQNYYGAIDLSNVQNLYMEDSATTPLALGAERFVDYLGASYSSDYSLQYGIGAINQSDLVVKNDTQLTTNIDVKIDAGGVFINPVWGYHGNTNLSNDMTFSADSYNSTDVHYKNYIFVTAIISVSLFTPSANGFISTIESDSISKYTLQNIEGYIMRNEYVTDIEIKDIVKSSNIIIKSNSDTYGNFINGATREFAHDKGLNSTYDFSAITPEVGTDYLFTFDEIESDLVKSATTPALDSRIISAGSAQYQAILGNMAVNDVAGGIASVYGADATANINAGLGYAVLAFTNIENLGRIMDGNEGATNADDSVETYYGMSGVKNLLGTKGDDTFSWGKGYAVAGATTAVVVGAFWNTRNTLHEGSVDMGDGDDTYLSQIISADMGYGPGVWHGGKIAVDHIESTISGVANTDAIEKIDITNTENFVVDDYTSTYTHLTTDGGDALSFYKGMGADMTVEANVFQDSKQHVIDLGGSAIEKVAFGGTNFYNMNSRLQVNIANVDEFVPVNNAITSSGVMSATAFQAGSVTMYNISKFMLSGLSDDGVYSSMSGATDRGRNLDWANKHLDANAYNHTRIILSTNTSGTDIGSGKLEFYADVGVNYILKSTHIVTDPYRTGAGLVFSFVDIKDHATGEEFAINAFNNPSVTTYFAVLDPNNVVKSQFHTDSKNPDIAWFTSTDVLNGLTRSGPADDYAARALNMEDEKIAKDESKDESNDNNKKDESSEPDIEFKGNGKMEADFFGRGSTNKGNQNNTNPDNTTEDEVGVNDASSNFESHSANSFAQSKSVDDLTYVNSKPLSNASNLDLSLKLEEAELDLSNLMQLIEETPTTDVSQLDAVNEDMGNLPENLLELTNTIDASDSMSYALEDGGSSIESSNQEVVAMHEPKNKVHNS